MNCAKCSKLLGDDEDWPSCSECNGLFHFAPCSLKQATWKKYGEEKQSTWRCVPCRDKREDEKDDDDMSTKDDESNIKDFLKQFKVEIMAEIQTVVTKIEESQDFISSQYEDMKKNLAEMGNKLKELSLLPAKIQKLEQEMEVRDKKIQHLEERLIKQEQYSRIKQIEIRGVQQTDAENTDAITIKVAEKLGVTVKKEDIEISHRLRPTKESPNPAIIVAFSNRKVKNSILEARKNCEIQNKDVFGKEAIDSKIFVGESLSPFYKHLFWRTKTTAKAADYRYVWWNGTTISARKTETSSIIRIKKEEDLSKII